MSKAPRPPVEMTLRIHGESDEALAYQLEMLAGQVRMRQVSTSGFAGGAGGGWDYTLERRDVSAEQYRHELSDWFDSKQAQPEGRGGGS